MKPLTIEELKALPMGDWVWVVDKTYSCEYYAEIQSVDISWLCISSATYTALNEGLRWDTYGEEWIAYKNKEQAEAKGEIIEPPCKVGDTVYYVGLYDCEKNHIDEQDEEALKEISDYCATIGGSCDECKYANPTIKTTVCERIIITKDGIFVDDFSDVPFSIEELAFTESEAERRLAELKGE